MCVLMFESSHRPDGKNADVLALTHACTTANASVNYSMYVPQRPCKVPIAPMGRLLTCLPRFSLAHLRLTLLSTTGGTCCRDLKLLHRLKVPIAPMGFSHVCARLCLQGGGVAVSGGTVSFSSCTITGNTATGVRAHAQNFPSPRWENG